MVIQPKKQQINKKVVTLAVVVVCLAVIAAVKLFIKSSAPPLAASAGAARAKGNPAASLKIIEYMDFQCPACAKGAMYLHDTLAQKPNDIYLEVKYFPLEKAHTHAIRAARYAECAARQGKFWQFHDEVFTHQNDWKLMMIA